MTERLATAAARHPGLTLGAWLVAVVVSLVLIVFFLGDALSGEAEQLNNPESEQAYSLIGERLPPDPKLHDGRRPHPLGQPRNGWSRIRSPV